MTPIQQPNVDHEQVVAAAVQAALDGVLNQLNDHYVAYDQEWRYVVVNDAAAAVLGLPKDQLLGRSIWELFPEAVGNDYYRALHQAFEEQRNLVLEFYYQPFQRWFENRVYASPRGVAVLSTDITARKHVEEALRASELRYRDLVANSAEGVYRLEFDPPISTQLAIDEQIARVYRDGRFAECNDAFARMYGFTHAQELVGQTLELMLPPDDPAARAYLQWLIEAGYRVTDVESVEHDRNDQLVYFANSIIGVVEADLLVRAWGIQRDITDRKLAEERVRQSEERFRTLATTLPQLIWTAKPDGSVDYLNPQWADYFGFAPEQLYDWSWQQVVHPDDLPHTLRDWGGSIRSGAALEIKHRFRHHTGEWRWQLVRGRAIVDEAGHVTKWVGTCTDIHETETREQDARFLSNVGELIRVGLHADQLLAQVAHTTGAYLGAARCFFAEVDDAANGWTVAEDYQASTLPSIAGSYAISAYPPQVAAALRSGRVVVVADTATHEATAPFHAVGYQPLGVQSFVVVPLLRNNLWVASFAAFAAVPQHWSTREIGLLEGIAERTWNTVEQLRTAEALRIREADLALALQAGRAGTFTWDLQRDVNIWSPELEALYGLLPGTFEGSYQAWATRIVPDDMRAVEQALQAALRAQADEHAYEFRATLPDGTRRWFAGRARFDYDASGTPLRMRGINIDIHERKQNELHAQFLLDLDTHLNQLGDPAAIEQAVVDRLGDHLDLHRCFFGHVDGNQVMVRREWRRGKQSAVATYQLADYFSPEAIDQFRANAPIVVEDVAHDPRTAMVAARYLVFEITAFVTTPVFHQGRWVGTLTIANTRPRVWGTDELRLLRDVAARVWPLLEQARAVQALRASEEQLQRLYTQEQAARAAAEEASRLKDEFLATVSHELRTPLTAILGYAHLLGSRKRDEEYVARTVAKILHNAQAQLQLTEDILDVARVVSGKLHIDVQPIDMSAVIAAAIDTVRPALEAKAIRFELVLDPMMVSLQGDPQRLQQVVWNLLSNAVKFTPPQGTVTVRWQVLGAIGRLTISDTGQGIKADFLPYVFDRFRQADSSSTRSHSGLGLGLSIVRHLVELHGGTVTAYSAGIGRGATFCVELPLGAPAQQGVAANDEPVLVQPACPPELRGLRVLVVDDQPFLLELLRDVLEPCEVEVRTCSTAGDGLAMLRSWRPDALISDIAMPQQDGYWLIEQVRALDASKGGATPAVALTAYARVEERTRVLATGFQRYVPKPVEPMELLDVLADLVRVSR